MACFLLLKMGNRGLKEMSFFILSMFSLHAFSQEVIDAVKKGEIEKVKALLNQNTGSINFISL